MIAGIIGKPNVGKSTFFNAATLLNVPMANYPFTTVKPNLGIGYVTTRCVCRALSVEDRPVNSRCIDGVRLIPVKLVDVAGLVPGASQGRGLGNKFLDDLRQADVLIHVVDASGSTDEEGVEGPPGTHDPVKDVEFVEREFDIWLKQMVEKDWPRISRSVDAGTYKAVEIISERLSGLSITESHIKAAAEKAKLPLDKLRSWSDEDLLRFCDTLREVSKPTIIAANKADLPSAKENIDRLKATERFVIPCTAEAELLLRRASEKGLIDYIPGSSTFKVSKNVTLTPQQARALDMVSERVLKIWGSTGVQQILNSAYLDLMQGIVVYPVEDEGRLSDKSGNVLPDAYIMRRGSKARDLAYAIHTDLGRTFLYAVDAKTGMRLGADYTLKDSDVIKIVAAAKRG